MRSIDEIRNALVELRAIARGNDMQVFMRPERAERHAPLHVRVSVLSSVGGLAAHYRRGDDPVGLIESLIASLERAGITCRRYEGDPR